MKRTSRLIICCTILLILVFRLAKPLIQNYGMIIFQHTFANTQLADFNLFNDYSYSRLIQLESLFELITNLDPDNNSAWLRLGLVEYLKGNEEVSFSIWESHIKERDTLNIIGSFYESQYEYENALRIYELAVSVPGNIGLSNLYFRIGYLHQFDQHPVNLEAASSAYKRALEISDFYPEEWRKIETYNYLGNINFSLMNFNEAIRYYKLSLAENPNQYWTLINLGRSLWQTMDFPNAKLVLEQAENLDQTHVDAYLLIGRIALSEGRINEARDSYEQVLRIEPNNEEANKALRNITK